MVVARAPDESTVSGTDIPDLRNDVLENARGTGLCISFSKFPPDDAKICGVLEPVESVSPMLRCQEFLAVRRVNMK